MNMHQPPHWKHFTHNWPQGLPYKRRFLFRRFAVAFGAMALVFLVTIAIVVSLLSGPLHEALPQGYLPVALACGVPLGFILMAGLVGSWAFRRIGPPVADIMAAADAVADGDLSVRVREELPGEFGRLARSFNRMTAELARAEQQRQNLTADVAHELRTPLHILQGNLEGILDGVYEPDPEHIRTMLEETRLLSRLVNDLQTLSLAESGQLPLHRLRVSVADLLADAATSFGGPAAEAGVALEVVVEGEKEALEVEVDPDRMGQVLNNLVTNALRFTPTGGRITLEASHISNGVRLSVQDSGAGIPAEELAFIFDRFWRSDPSRRRQEGTGSGLGLAIARQLVQAHGGKIAVESKEGEGTRFTIDLYH